MSDARIDSNQPAQPTGRSGAGHRLLFVAFVLAAFCLFAPSILFPVLSVHVGLLEEETRLRGQRAALEEQIRRHDALLEAFRSDPDINKRLAVLDLRFQRPDEVVIPILSGDRANEPSVPPIREWRETISLPADWPEEGRRLMRWADENGLIGLYMDTSLRPALLLMAGGLMLAAFILFAPRADRSIEACVEIAMPQPNR